MSWATAYIEKLKAGETVQFRPRGNSMLPRIKSGQLVTVSPLKEDPDVGDVVLCKVHGKQYLHLVRAVRPTKGDSQYQIGNNKGFVNGWIGISNVYGILVRVED